MDAPVELTDPGTYMLNIQLGRLLVIIFLFSAVVLAGIQSLFKDVLLFCVARYHIARGYPVSLKRAPRILRAVGIEKFISSRNHHISFAAALRLLVVTFLPIIAGAFFENSLEQLHIPTVSTFRTLEEPPHPLVVRSAFETTLLSPFPTTPVSEAHIGQLAPFSPNGTTASQEGPYRVREDSRIALSFSSSCVSPPDPNTSIVSVYAAALIAPRSPEDPPEAATAAARSGRVRIVRCLDGVAATAHRVVATFRARDDLQTGSRVTRVELLLLRNAEGMSTDSVSAVYGAAVFDERGTRREGYVTVTKRSHFDANVQFSMYGLVRAPGDEEVFRVNIPLYLSRKTLSAFPCFDERVSVKYAGNWTFDGGNYTCPDGVRRPLKREDQEVQSVGLYINPTMSVPLNGSDTGSGRNNDLLVWLAETDYARFTAAATFSEELTVRVRSRRLFYSAVGEQVISTTDGGQREAVQVGRRESIVYLTSISVLLLYVGISVTWSVLQQRKWKLYSEVISFEAVINMFSAAERVASGRAGFRDDGRCLTIGLRSGTDERDGIQVDVQVLGPVRADEAIPRKACIPLIGG